MIKRFFAPIFISLLIVSFLLSIINSCRHDSVISQLSPIDFNAQILPIIQSNCAYSGCHDGLGEERRINLTSYDNIMKIVVPGKPYSSRLYTSLIDVYGNIMPPRGPLTEGQRMLIKVWIEQGAKNTIDTSQHIVTCDTNNITLANKINTILNDNCLSCHSNANAASLGLGIKLQDSADIATWSPRIIGAIQHKQGFFAMPKEQPQLDSCKIIQIAIWIRKLNVKDTTNPSVLAGYACFSRDILPIIQSSCSMAGTTCHNSTGEESLPLLNYNDVRQIVIPGHPGNSSLYVVITNPSENFMPPPPYSPLPQANIDSIYSWILQGATNQTCSVLCDTNKFTFVNYVSPIILTNCKGCHSGANAQKGVLLENYATISSVANSGELVKSITGKGNPIMPPGNPLSACNQIIIEKWTKAGAPNN